MYKCLFFSEDNDSYKLILSVSVSNIAFCSLTATFRTGAGSHGETGSDKQYEDQYFSFHFLWYLKLNNANSAVKRGYCLDWPFREDAECIFGRIAEQNSKEQQIIYLCNPWSQLKTILAINSVKYF